MSLEGRGDGWAGFVDYIVLCSGLSVKSDVEALPVGSRNFIQPVTSPVLFI